MNRKSSEMKNMNSKNKICGIVDAGSSGKYLTKEFSKSGYQVFNIQSSKTLNPLYLKINTEDIFDNIIFENSENFFTTIKKLNPEFILPGSEAGVLVSDFINHTLELKLANNFKLSDCRRDKYKMIEELHKNKIPAAKHFKSAKWEDIKAWFKAHGKVPVVIKPLNSAGGNNVWICHDLKHLWDAYQNIIGKINPLGLVNNEVLIQSYLEGTEYIVNTVSCQGIHHISEIWKYKKLIINNKIFYDYDEWCSSDIDIYSDMNKYVKQVLNALKISYGPCHAEIMLTEDGPKLVEIAARLPGALNPDVLDLVVDIGQIKLTVLAYTNPVEFKKHTTKRYHLKQNSISVILNTNVEGVLQSLPYLDNIKKLKTFYCYDFLYSRNDKIEKTRDAFNEFGIIYLVHHNKELIMEDYRRIREFEKKGFYTVI